MVRIAFIQETHRERGLTHLALIAAGSALLGVFVVVAVGSEPLETNSPIEFGVGKRENGVDVHAVALGLYLAILETARNIAGDEILEVKGIVLFE